MYYIIFSDLALKQLKKLDKNPKQRIVVAIERARIRSCDYAKKLVGSQYSRLRAVDYKIIINIQQNELRIFVIELGRRKNIYK